MRIGASVSIGVLLVLAMAGSARAQDDRRIHVNFGGGPTFIFGDIGERFSTGWGPAVGVTFDVNPRIGIQFEYAYRWFQVKDELDIQAGKFSANHQHAPAGVQHGREADESRQRRDVLCDRRSRACTTGEIEITEYEGNGIICDPWFYVAARYPIESIVGSRGGWDFGFNVGAGVGLPIGEGLRVLHRVALSPCLGTGSHPARGLSSSERRPRRRRTASTCR